MGTDLSAVSDRTRFTFHAATVESRIQSYRHGIPYGFLESRPNDPICNFSIELGGWEQCEFCTKRSGRHVDKKQHGALTGKVSAA